LVGLRGGPLLEAYRIIAEVAASGSMSRAAWNLDLDVSVVSRHVAAVERAFDCGLFERHRRGVRLTEAGALVTKHVERVLRQEDRLRNEISELRQLRLGSIRVAATDGAISGPLSAALASFCRSHPGVQIELFRTSSEQVVPALHRGDAELGAGLDIGADAGVEIVAHLDDILAAVVSPRHRLARRRSVTLADFGADPVGTFERNSGVGRALQRLVGKGVAPRLALVTNSLDALKALAEGANGICVSCPHAVQKEIDERRLVAVPIQAGGPLRIALDVCVLAGERRSFALNSFIAEILRLGSFGRDRASPPRLAEQEESVPGRNAHRAWASKRRQSTGSEVRSENPQTSPADASNGSPT
jgi:DNA-binding transcriptional LysR family regulator